MRRLLHLAACIVLTAATAHAQTTPDLPQQYLALYVKMHDSEVLEKNGDYAGALKSFQKCYDGFASMAKTNPDWETALVGHRLDDCKVSVEKMQNLVAELPAAFSTTTASSLPSSAQLKTGDLATRQIHSYPWKTGIKTEMFYFGEPSSLGWDAGWVQANHGTDNPNDRNGYASAGHAATINPFYVSLPFNDLTHPDKAKQYVPAWWQRALQDGKPVSTCKDRWVEIKPEDGTGHVCYAQWEDIGPERDDHAEYVFGNESPDPKHAGIGISPAVVQYLGLMGDDSKIAATTVRWRFVDAAELPPGAWLKYDEQSIIYQAMHATKNTPAVLDDGKSTDSSPPQSLPAISTGVTKP